MDFFSSVFSTHQDQDEEEEGEQELEAATAAAAAEFSSPEAEEKEDECDGGAGTVWSFGGLIRTFASRSESVLQGYRRDLEDFSSGFRFETSSLRAAAARAASSLPTALEAGASAASESLESVGQAVDDLGAAAAVLLSHANHALISADSDADASDHEPSDADHFSWRPPLQARKYTRLEAQVLALRADPATFTDEPDDTQGFAKWRSEFRLDERKEEIDAVLRESPGLESFIERLVPLVVDYETYWCRYFFRVDKLRQAEDVRAKLVNRAMSKEAEEEELSWEVDDNDDNGAKDRGNQDRGNQEKAVEKDVVVVGSELVEDKDMIEVPPDGNSGGSEYVDDKQIATATVNVENNESNAEDSIAQEGKTEAGDSSKESDFSVVSHPSTQEEDLSWEEIEDLGEHEEKGASPHLSPPRKVDFHKRLSSADDDEELSWDVEEEDEPAKL